MIRHACKADEVISVSHLTPAPPFTRPSNSFHGTLLLNVPPRLIDIGCNSSFKKAKNATRPTAHGSGQPEYHTSTRELKEIIDNGEEVSIHDGKEGIAAGTRGAALSITVSVPKKVSGSTLLTSGLRLGGWEVGMT